MKKFLILFIFIFSVSVYAEDKVIIKNGEFKIITLENFNTDQLPHQVDYFRMASDRAIGCMYLDQSSGTQFFVLIHEKNMGEFNRGWEYGLRNVRMKVNLLTSFNGLSIYEFVKWSN